MRRYTAAQKFFLREKDYISAFDSQVWIYQEKDLKLIIKVISLFDNKKSNFFCIAQ